MCYFSLVVPIVPTACMCNVHQRMQTTRDYSIYFHCLERSFKSIEFIRVQVQYIKNEIVDAHIQMHLKRTRSYSRSGHYTFLLYVYQQIIKS